MLAIFKSRAETIRFFSSLKANGIIAYRVPTPEKKGDMCNISVSFPSKDIKTARLALATGNYYSFVGFFN